MNEIGSAVIEKTEQLSEECNKLSFTFDGIVYNPLDYAWENHRRYLEKAASHKIDVLFLGMNPGPFGMMQTGVPFGEINAVLNYLKLDSPVSKPKIEHPGRPITGLETKRSEVSGLRFWGLVSSVFPEADSFFEKHTVFNYCPLGFLSNAETAKNITPDHLLKNEREALERLCDTYLYEIIGILEPEYLIGIGKYAEAKLAKVNDSISRTVTSVIHPSPGNPQANKGWAEKTSAKLKELGIWK